jgi:hypothetical protein
VPELIGLGFNSQWHPKRAKRARKSRKKVGPDEG